MISSVVIDYFNLESIASFKPKTHAPLIANANAVLTRAVADKFLKPVAGRYAQKFQSKCSVDLLKFAHRHRSNVGEPSHTLTVKQRLGVFAVERRNHGGNTSESR